ncbi:MAG: outer membrane lipoprotein-sorting protein [Chthoniobacter sp.]|nr:outer membrane lipoprotein-sorting protein [Chthoniobacter sp.]
MNLSRLLPAVFLCLTGIASAADTAASDLASKLSALRQDGASYVRLRMEIKGPKPETLQLQIKQRLTKGSSEVVYQVLFPKERKGESVLLKKSGGRASGNFFMPPGTVRPINDLKEPLFGSDLSYEDIIDNFYAWDQQAIVGTEAVDGVSCQILESKPGKGDRSTYGSVRSWIDPKRLVPLRIEKYSGSGQLLRRIDTTRVVTDAGHPIPANLSVRGARQDSSTQLDGSRIKHDVNFTESDFSVDGLKDVTVPRGTPE